MLSDLLFRVRSLFRRKTVETELEEELRFHRRQQFDKYLSSGLSEAEARRRVELEFGGLEQVKEECRDARGVRLMDNVLRDLRYGLRMLRKSPGFTAVALLTLALGIGANTAIFSVLYGVLLRPLPYKDASTLIILNETTPRVGTVSVSFPNFIDWRAQGHSFSDLVAVNSVAFNLSGVDQPENISGEAVSSNFLSALGIRPLLGRDFEAAEDKPGAAPVALLSYSLWQSHFGGERSALGRTIALDGRSYTIVGILGPEFRWIEKTDVLEPIGVWAAGNSAYDERGDRGDMVVLGRLAPRISFAKAKAEMEGIAARLAKAYPSTNDQFGVKLQPIRDAYVSDIRPAVLVLFGAVTFVLLIACANVANLFLMRGASRTREMALRMAIGATRGRIIGQMVAESFILTSLGGLGGIAVAILAIRGLVPLIPAEMLAGATVDLNGAALIFAGAVVALCAFVFGLTPALQSAKSDVQSELKEGARGTSAGAGANRWRGVLVMAEVALALILLVGTGLMMKSLYRLLSVDAGIRTERVLTMQLSLRTAQYDKGPAILHFWDQVIGRVSELPGVESAALGTGVPLTYDHSRTDITVEGMALPKPGSFPHPDVHIVSPDYVRTLGVQLLSGRTFTAMDNEGSPPVALVNKRVADQLFRGTDALGKRFLFGHPSPINKRPWVTIIGVVGDTRMYGLENPSRLEVYVPLHQQFSGSMTLLVKSKMDPAVLTSAIRGAVAAIDKDQPLYGVSTMGQLMTASVYTRRITFVVLGAFSLLALVLSAIGIYGVISYSVAQRTQEIGIRVALGAQPGDVLRLVIVQGSKMIGAGISIGVVASFVLTRLMKKLLYSVSSADPATFIAVTIVLALIAVTACYIPARRTLRVDPMRTLRSE